MVDSTGRKLKAAQKGSDVDVLKLISEDSSRGRSWLVTVVCRKQSAQRVQLQPPTVLAHLADMSARVHWQPWAFAGRQNTDDQPAFSSNLSPTMEYQLKDTLRRRLSSSRTNRTGPERHMSTDSFDMSSMDRALLQIPDVMQTSYCSDNGMEYFQGIHLTLNAESASILPLAIDGQVLHGRDFTWRQDCYAVTMLSSSVAGAFATHAQPYAAKSNWLH